MVIPLDEIGLHPSSARIARIAGTPALQVLHRPLKGSQALLKLAEDYILGGIGLLIVSPLMLLVAIAIKLDSKGPVFFKQERTGYGTNSFMIYKFRTMTVDPTDDGSSGTMSRDNPPHHPRRRPAAAAEHRRAAAADQRATRRHVDRRPAALCAEHAGRGRDVSQCRAALRLPLPAEAGDHRAGAVERMRSNALRSMDNAQRSVEMDVEYIMSWSIWLDVRIMLRTVLVAMSGPEVF